MISFSANRSRSCGAMALSNLRSGMNRIGLSARSAQGSRRQATRTEHIVVPYHYPIFTGVYDGQSTKAQQSGNSKTQGRKDQVFSRAGGLADHGCLDARWIFQQEGLTDRRSHGYPPPAISMPHGAFHYSALPPPPSSLFAKTQTPQ